MKKYIVLILSILLIAGVITSCDNKLSNNSNETVSVTFSSDDGTRDLTSSNSLFNVSDLYWKYTAVKANDGTGLTQGATSEQRWIYGGSDSTSIKKGLGVVGGFSQGLWNFTLYGYSDNAGSTLICQGSTATSIKFGSANNVNVQVKPITTGSVKGTLIINPITFTPNQGSATNLTCKYTVTSVGGTTEITGDLASEETISLSLQPGSYNVTIEFVDTNNFVYATGSKLVTIYNNLTTTLSGSLNELITSTGVGAYPPPELKPIGGVIFHVADDNGATYTFYDSAKNKIEPSGGSFTVSDLLEAAYYTVSGKAENVADRFFVLYTKDHLFKKNVYWGFYNKDFTEITRDSTGKSNTNTILKYIEDNKLKDETPKDYSDTSTNKYRNCGTTGKYLWDLLIDFNDSTKTSTTGNTTELYDWYIPSYDEMMNLGTNYSIILKNKKIDFKLDEYVGYKTSTETSETPKTRYRGVNWRGGGFTYEYTNKNDKEQNCVVIRSF